MVGVGWDSDQVNEAVRIQQVHRTFEMGPALAAASPDFFFLFFLAFHWTVCFRADLCSQKMEQKQQRCYNVSLPVPTCTQPSP